MVCFYDHTSLKEALIKLRMRVTRKNIKAFLKLKRKKYLTFSVQQH